MKLPTREGPIEARFVWDDFPILPGYKVVFKDGSTKTPSMWFKDGKETKNPMMAQKSEKYMPNGEFSAKQIAEFIEQSQSFVSVAETGEFLAFDEENGVYKPMSDIEITNHLERISYRNLSQHNTAEVLHLLRSKRVARITDFDSYPDVVCVKNGILDLNTGQLSEHSPDRLFRLMIPVSYDKNAKARRFQKFLKRSVPNPEARKMLIEAIAGCLNRRPVKRDSLFVHGPRNGGKSTFLGIVRAFLGRDNVSGVSLQALSGGDRFAAAQLFNKMANIHPDLSDVEIKKTGDYKALTGGDLITAQRKHGQLFEFVNTAQFLFSANKLPEIHDRSDLAFFDRFQLGEFPFSFGLPDGEENPEFTRRSKQDLLQELTTDEELSGILNLVLAVWKKGKIKSGRFPTRKSALEVASIWVENSDFSRKIIHELVENDPEGTVASDEFWLKFEEKRALYKLPTIKRSSFLAKVVECFPHAKHGKLSKTDRRNGFRGIKWHEKHALIGTLRAQEPTSPTNF